MHRGSSIFVSCLGSFLLSLLAPTASHAAVFVVDAAAGDDDNPGTATEPFATVQRGVNAAAELVGPDSVLVRAGIYSENVAISDEEAVTLLGSENAEIAAADPEDATIAITSGDVTIQGLAVTGGDPGIGAEPAEGSTVSLTLRHVHSDGNSDRGVNVENAESVRVFGGTFNANDGDGIKVEKVPTVVVENADVSGNDSDGLDLEENGSIALVRLTVNGNGDEGVEVDDTQSITVFACETIGNADDGLDIDNTASILVVGCVSKGNGDFEDPEDPNGNGLQVEADDEDFPVQRVVVVNSEFSSNSENGVHVVEDGVLVDLVSLMSVAAHDNQLSGVRLEVSGEVRVANIVSTGNGEDDVIP